MTGDDHIVLALSADKRLVAVLPRGFVGADYENWIAMGGEGIVLKDRTSLYRPGRRSPAWLKLKPKLTREVVVTGGSAGLAPVWWRPIL